MAVPEQSPHSSALHSVIWFAESDFNVPIKVVALFYFFHSSLRENAKPVIAPFASAAAKRELDSAMLLTLHSGAKKKRLCSLAGRTACHMMPPQGSAMGGQV